MLSVPVKGCSRISPTPWTRAPGISSFSDQDDRWAPGKVERVAAIFQARPEVMAVLHDAALVDGQMHPWAATCLPCGTAGRDSGKTYGKTAMGSCMGVSQGAASGRPAHPRGPADARPVVGYAGRAGGGGGAIARAAAALPAACGHRHSGQAWRSLATMVRNRARLLAAPDRPARRGAPIGGGGARA